MAATLNFGAPQLWAAYQPLPIPASSPITPLAAASSASTSNYTMPQTETPTVLNARAMFAQLQRRELTGHKKGLFDLQWNEAGTKIVAGSTDSQVRVWNVMSTSTAPAAELKGHSSAVNACAWDPSGNDRVASVSSDRSLKLWDLKSNKCALSLDTKVENLAMSWSPDSTRIALASKKDAMAFVDVRKFKVVAEKQWDDQLNKIEFHPSGSHLVAATGKGEVIFVDPSSFAIKHSLVAHVAPCYSVDISACGRYMASSGGEGLCGYWDLSEMACVQSFTSRESFARFVSLSHDNAMLACLCEDNTIDVHDIASGELILSMPPLKESCFGIAWNPKSHMLAWVGDERNAANAPILSLLAPPAK